MRNATLNDTEGQIYHKLRQIPIRSCNYNDLANYNAISYGHISLSHAVVFYLEVCPSKKLKPIL